jgi:hydroxymethylbilane synthase
MKNTTVRLGTRSSLLALTQSRMIAGLLAMAHKGLTVELVEISTTGDTVTDKPLNSFGGSGVFVKELESALLDKRVDFAVHSLKDLPTKQPKGLTLGAVVGREDTRDAAIVRGGVKLADLPKGSVIGSGSSRRRAQLKAVYPHLEFSEIRGNVETRLRKVEQGEYAGTVLACAGLRRLGLLRKLDAEVLPLAQVLPAPGQGALGLECRSRDLRTQKLLAKLHNADVAACVLAERSALATLGGGCHLPLGALGTISKSSGKRVLRLRTVIGMPDGTLLTRRHGAAPLRQAEKLGAEVGLALLNAGGREVLEKLGEPLP